MIGHCTVLIETADGLHILTDPFFGIWHNPFYGRFTPPARTRQELLDVDMVLVSHNHFDHADARFLHMLPDTTPVVVPRLAARFTRLLGARYTIGLRTWESCTLGGAKITAVPAIHLAIANGYVIEADGQTLYFAGDTRYGKFLAEIGRRFRPQVAMLPVSTYRIAMTLSERETIQAAIDLQVEALIPIHQAMGSRLKLLQPQSSPGNLKLRPQESGSQTQVVILKEGITWDIGPRVVIANI